MTTCWWLGVVRLPGMLIHESSYRQGLAAYVHRARLRGILRELTRIGLPETGSLADFGCSNGFILEQIRNTVLPDDGWMCHGFDHDERLLAMARERAIPDTTFDQIDLNQAGSQPPGQFTLCLSFETLEHTGDFRRAISTIVGSCAPGGWVLVSVPVEKRAPGLVKLLARPLVRRRPYGTFFHRQSKRSYLAAVATGRDIERFRLPARRAWGPHLGFDCDRFEDYLRDEILSRGHYRLVRRSKTFAGFNRLYILHRVDEIAT